MSSSVNVVKIILKLSLEVFLTFSKNKIIYQRHFLSQFSMLTGTGELIPANARCFCRWMTSKGSTRFLKW
jgi:hypothetical protein